MTRLRVREEDGRAPALRFREAVYDGTVGEIDHDSIVVFLHQSTGRYNPSAPQYVPGLHIDAFYNDTRRIFRIVHVDQHEHLRA